MLCGKHEMGDYTNLPVFLSLPFLRLLVLFLAYVLHEVGPMLTSLA